MKKINHVVIFETKDYLDPDFSEMVQRMSRQKLILFFFFFFFFFLIWIEMESLEDISCGENKLQSLIA
jgi:hypothetical protein